jgi:ketosteroid isomerase-like protein
MSRENVEAVLSLYGRAQRRDFDNPFDRIDEGVVWDMTGLGMPDLAGVYRGHDGLQEFWAAWLDAWESIEFTRAEPEDLGDHVIVEVKQRNVGRGSGVPVDFHYFQTFSFREGKVTASYMAETRAGALKAVRLRE